MNTNDIRGDFILAVSKGLLHKLGNITNGLSVNIQALFSLNILTSQNEKFFKRVHNNMQAFWLYHRIHAVRPFKSYPPGQPGDVEFYSGLRFLG